MFQIFVKSLNREIAVDCAFGGMWYAIVDIETNNIGLPKLVPQNGNRLAKLGEEIKVIYFKRKYIQFLKKIFSYFRCIYV